MLALRLRHHGQAGVLLLSKYLQRRRLKYWTARSWASAAALVSNVPRFRRLPVSGFFLRDAGEVVLPKFQLCSQKPLLMPVLASEAD